MSVLEILENYVNVFPNEYIKLENIYKLINNNKKDLTMLFDRKNFEGHITASGFIYCPSERKFLLLEHKSLKKYLQPGGHVERLDSSIISAAKREVLEETGITDYNILGFTDNENIPFDIDSHFIPANDKKKESSHYHHDFRFLFLVDKMCDVKIDNNESNGYKWVSIDEIKNMDGYKTIIEKVENLTNFKMKYKK